VLSAGAGVLAHPANADAVVEKGTLTELASPYLSHGLHLFWQGVEQQPSLMLAGAMATAVPLVGAIAAILRAMSRRARFRARMRQLATHVPPAGAIRPNLAWLQIESHQAPPLRLGELLRIGGSSDCDLTLAESGIAGIHALIQRTPDSEFVIFDVSDATEAQLAVNGTPSRRCSLNDGDRIEIGGTRVVFHAKWVSEASGQPALA